MATQQSTDHSDDITLNTSINPADDFFGYVNSRWLAQHPIPDTETRWGTFNVLREESWIAMRSIYEGLQGTTPAPQSIEQQARDLYYTGMHFNELEAAHFSDIRAILAKIDTIKTIKDLSYAIGYLQSLDISGPWTSYVDADHDDSSKHIFYIAQSGLSLPNRDYYLDDSEKMQAFRVAYETFGRQTFTHFPEMAADQDTFWQTIIGLETDIAAISRSSADLRDVEKNNNKMTLKQVSTQFTTINWQAYAEGLGWSIDDKISIRQPEFMAFVSDTFTSRPLDDWKTYLKWRVVRSLMTKVNDQLAELHFSFYGKTLSGALENMPLWKRIVLGLEGTIGDATGRLYAKTYFPESSKQKVLSLVEDVRAAYGERIDMLDWMTDSTKTYAKKKLANMKVLIGYPDVWRDFTDLEIGRTSYVANILAAQRLESRYWLDKLQQPTSREDWFMTPQTVNAYHDPNRLVICFPAGILQPPFFSPHASYAANMGGIGAVIGHELSHGFDDQGCLYDADGNVRTWQTDEERATFMKKAQIIVDQADAFHVLPDLTLKGKLILGESIADLGGIEIALHALKHQAGEDVTSADLKDFFIQFAFTECQQVREEKLREFTLSDPHPASEFRVNGMLQHVDTFYEVFNVTSTNSLYHPSTERARIW